MACRCHTLGVGLSAATKPCHASGWPGHTAVTLGIAVSAAKSCTSPQTTPHHGHICPPQHSQLRSQAACTGVVNLRWCFRHQHALLAHSLHSIRTSAILLQQKKSGVHHQAANKRSHCARSRPGHAVKPDVCPSLNACSPQRTCSIIFCDMTK